MLDKSNDDSSSSENEIPKDALEEAVDHQFLKNSYLSNHSSEKTDISKETDEQNDLTKYENSTKPISLRKDSENQDRFFNFGVSPSFQSYVAKQLDGIIEKSIRIKKKKVDDVTDEKESEDNNCGIKLLNSSVDFLSAKEESIEEKLQRKRKIETTIDQETTLAKCKEVALEPDRILSKEETKAWTSKRKEPEFKYKRLKNGTLIEKT